MVCVRIIIYKINKQRLKKKPIKTQFACVQYRHCSIEKAIVYKEYN